MNRLRLVVTIFGILLLGGFFRLMYLGYVDQPKAGAKQPVEIVTGMSVQATASLLEKKGVISSARWYRMYAWFSGTARRPRAGFYEINPGSSFHKIAIQLALGPEKNEVQLQVIEGWTLKDVSTLLLGQKTSSTEIEASIGKQGDDLPFAAHWREEFPFLRALPTTRSLEGYLFPDTYRVWGDQLPEGLVRKQLQSFQTQFEGTLPSTESRPLLTLDDVVILASVVEKEVPHPADRRHVAGIFLRRLKQGIALQSDATLSYVTGSKRDRATAKELELETAYNSYRHRGLPPSPICNPGAASIEAVLNPLPTKDLYFLTDKDGRVYYAETFEQHIRNRQKAGI